jgi:hypothetical protein
MKEIVIFGGWDSDNLTDSYFLKEDTPNKFSIQAEDECYLQDADLFLFTGAFRQDTDKGEVVVCGQDYLHRFTEKDREFETIRKIE